MASEGLKKPSRLKKSQDLKVIKDLLQGRLVTFSCEGSRVQKLGFWTVGLGLGFRV